MLKTLSFPTAVMLPSRKRKRGQEGPESRPKRPVPNEGDHNNDSAPGSDSDVGHSEHILSAGENTSEQASGSEMEEDPSGDEGEQAELAGPKADHATRRPPTAQELRDIKDAADLYQSSSFKLQIDALLPNVRPRYQNSAPLDRFLTQLHSCLRSIPPVSPRHPLDAAKEMLKKNIAIPYPLPAPTQDTNWKVAFESPSDILLSGSWPNKLSVKAQDKHKFVVDLAVEMPSMLFQEKDYLNGRFFHKRAYYLSVIAAAILNKKNRLNAEAAYASAGGDPRLTCLIVRPEKGSENDLTKLNTEVRIVPTLNPTSPIPLQRLSPKRANIRANVTSEDTADETPSPIYNAALFLSTTPRAHLLQTHKLKSKVPAYIDAVTLLRVWANQRGYGKGSRFCIKGFEAISLALASVLDLLISGEEVGESSFGKSRRPIGAGLSSYQLFRAALDFIARHNFSHQPVFVKSDKGQQFSPEDYSSDAPVFTDSISTNLFASVPHGSLDMLRYDAETTLEVLNESYTAQDPFREVFLKDHRDLQTRFDAVIRVDLTSAKPRSPSLHSTLDHGSLYNFLLSSLLFALRRALGNRTKAIVCLQPASEERPLSEASPSNSPIIFLGLVYDVEHAFRLVDHGPAADNPDPSASQEFHEFWGDKAELRRFKDGSITESVVWDVKTSDEKTQIPYFICSHILGLHFGIPKESVQHWQDPFDALLRLPEPVASVHRAAKSEAGFKAALAAFDGLVKSIKALDDKLPLSVLNVSPVSDGLRYTSVFTPTALPTTALATLPRCAQFTQPIEVIVEFEKSARWPDDLRAIQKVKLAMLENLASKLMEFVPGLKATVVVGDHTVSSEIQDVARLEIVSPQGWVFSARIWHDREAMLLDNAIDNKPHIPKHIKRDLPDGPAPKQQREAIEAKEVYVKRFIHAPRHHRAIAALCHQHTAYAGTVRLVKRWLACHWVLQKYLSVEAVELLCASVFLGSPSKSGLPSQKPPTNVPGTKERGFARVVELLKDWKWAEGIFVPLYNNDQGDIDVVAKDGIFAGGRSGVWRISTEFDPEGFMWTRHAPDAVMARRIQTIAEATWRGLQDLTAGEVNVLTLFTHPAQEYDFVIQLNPELLPRYYQNFNVDSSVWVKKGKYANASSVNKTSSEGTQPGCDPAQLLFDDLSRVYQDTFMLFCDPLGGDRFGGVWDPRLKDPRPFKILGKFSAMPAPKSNKDKGLVVLNKEAILSEIERFGSGLITSIIQQE